eukprot:2756248-Amphidinium_carterae.1
MVAVAVELEVQIVSALKDIPMGGNSKKTDEHIHASALLQALEAACLDYGTEPGYCVHLSLEQAIKTARRLLAGKPEEQVDAVKTLDEQA